MAAALFYFENNGDFGQHTPATMIIWVVQGLPPLRIVSTA
jgi:hypothetical protein